MIDIEPDDDDAPWRWRWIAGLAAGAVLAAGIGLAVTRPWQSDSTGPVSTEPPAQLTNRLIVGEPPGDLTLTAAQPAGQRQGEADDDVVVLSDPTTVGQLFAADGSTLQRGKFVALYASPLDEADQFADEDEDADVITVRGMPGTIDIDDTDVSIAYWGPDDNGYRFNIAAKGIDSAAMVSAAEGFSVDNGVAVIEQGGALEGMQPLGEVRTLFLAFQLIVGSSPEDTSPQVTTVVYGDPFDGGMQVSSVPSPEDDPLRMFSFLFGTTTPTTVHGQTAVVGQNGADFGTDGSAVAWVEGGQLIVVSGSFSPAELIRAAQSVRPASAQEWAEIEQLGPAPGLDNEGG